MTFAAVYIDTTSIRRVWFESETEAKAREFCATHGFGFDGVSERPESNAAPVPVAYNEKTARQMLGGISRGALWADLALGRLDRVPHTRRLLITRESLERRCRKS